MLFFFFTILKLFAYILYNCIGYQRYLKTKPIHFRLGRKGAKNENN